MSNIKFKHYAKVSLLAMSALGLSACFDSDSNDVPELPANQAPIAEDAQFLTQTEVIIDSSLSASDPEGKVLSFSLNEDAVNGIVTLSDSGDFTYAPNNEFTGSDSFTFTVVDPGGLSASGSVNISVEALVVAFSDLSRLAFAQAESDSPLRVNGRDISNDVTDPAAYDDLLMDQP